MSSLADHEARLTTNEARLTTIEKKHSEDDTRKKTISEITKIIFFTVKTLIGVGIGIGGILGTTGALKMILQ